MKKIYTVGLPLIQRWIVILCFLGGGLGLTDEEKTVPFVPEVGVDQEWRITSLLEEGNLSNKYITSVDFESDGSAWISTSDGLYRYDGYTWQRYAIGDGLPSNFIRCVQITRTGKIWVGTDHGAACLENERFVGFHSTLDGSDSSIRQIVEDRQGNLWFCYDQWPDATGEGGLACWDGEKWTRFRVDNGFVSSHVFDYFQDSQERMFALTYEGLFEKHGDRWVDTLRQAGIADYSAILSIAENGDSEIFAANSSTLFRLKKGHWSSIPFPNSNPYSTFCSTRDGKMIACAPCGNHRQAFFEWSGETFRKVSASFESPTQELSMIRESPDGSIWCCGFDYLVRWQRQRGEWNEYRNLPPPRFEDGSHRIWFVGRNQAVRWEGDRWIQVNEFPWYAALDAKGNVWGWDLNRLTCWTKNRVDSYGIDNTGVGAINGLISDAHGDVWVFGTDFINNNRLACFSDTQWIPLFFPEIQNGYFRQCFPDPQSGVWILLCNEIQNHLDLVKVEKTGVIQTIHFEPGFQTFDNPFFLVDQEGGIWLYARFGIHYWSPTSPDSWMRVDPLPGRNVFAGVARNGELWFGCDGLIGGKGGLLHVHQGIMETYDSAVRQFGCKLQDGSIYFGGNDLFYQIPPGSNSQPISITLPDDGMVKNIVKDHRGDLWLGVGDRVLSFHSDGIPPETRILETETNLLRTQNLRSRFMALGRFLSPNTRKSYRYSWRIDHGSWSKFTSAASIQFPLRGLDPGKYTLQVRAMDEGGDIDASPSELVFHVHPIPFQERVWFKPVGLILFILFFLLSVIALVARSRLKHHLQNLEHIILDRTAELRENEERLRGLIESSSDWIWETDENLVYTYSSPKVRDFLGFEPQEIVGKTVYSLMPPDEAIRIYHWIKERMNPPTGFQCLENANLHKDGHIVIMETSAVPIIDSRGDFRGFRGIDRDITDRKKSEQDKKYLEEQLVQSQKMEAIGQLAGGLAHDFNNLLTVIIGNLELISLRASDGIKDLLSNTKNATSRASTLVKQLLTFSRKSSIELQSIDVHDLLHEMYQLVRETIDRRIDIVLDIEPNLPAVEGDLSLLNSVIMNLCINARDAIVDVMKGQMALDRLGGQYRIGIHAFSVVIDHETSQRLAFSQEGRFVCLCVTDNGIGMSNETMRHMFEPFFTTKKEGRGTGLGLANAYGIVKQHNGWITVESILEKGSKFFLYLPVSSKLAHRKKQESPVQICGGKETILFIDDEEMICQLTQTILEEKGYRVLVANNGEEGLNLFLRERERIDLIIIDYSMPFLSGAEVVKQIFAANSSVKVIVSSGFVDEWKMESLEKLGVNGFLDKPYRSEQLLRIVRDILEG